MTSKPRPPRPVESFGPEIMQVLLEGAKRRIDVTLPYSKAIRFRMRVNQLRNQMRLTSHEKYVIASQAKVTIAWPEDVPIRRTSKGLRIPLDPEAEVTLTVAPSDSEFSDVLARAGVTIPTIAPDTHSALEDDILAEFVKR